MNRRRTGIAALVIGVGAAVRQRLKTRVDAGPERDLDSSVAASSISTTEISAAEISVASTPSEPGASQVAVDSNDFSNNVPAASARPATDDDVAVDPAASSSELLAEATASAVSSSDLLDEASAGISLPTMPTAGTRTDPTAVVIPSAANPTELSAVVNETSSTVAASVAPLASSAASSDFTASTDSPASTDFTERADVDLAEPAVPAMNYVGPDASVADVPSGTADAVTDKQPFYRAHRGWSIVGGIVFGLFVVAFLAASFVRLPYYSLQPGSVYDTIERVEAPGDLVSIPRGDIGFVTVSQTANINTWQWLDAKLDNNITIRHEDEVQGDQTADELREADIRRMQVSKNSAVVVALQKLGFDLIITPVGIEVAQVFDCTAADGTLGTGDLIIGVNGVDVRTGEELVEQLMGQTVGAEVELLVERIDPTNPTQSMATDIVALTLGSADAACLPDDVRADEPRPFIGIGTLPIFNEDLPIEVDVRTGAVSGPSAGLAFTLAIMDVLSEGELTNELNVVASGTIDRDGNVGPVGGIHQKTIAAERSGADVFIVPKCCDNFVSSDTGEPLDLPSNYEEALLHADDMIVIGVDTLDEALIALGELGGDVDAFLEQVTS